MVALRSTGRRARAFLFVLLVVCGAAFVPSSAFAQVTLASDDPVALFNRGNELFDAGNYAEAYMFYEKSFRLRPSYDSASNAGSCAHTLGRYADAARLLRYGLDHIPGSLDPEKRAAAEKRLNELFADSASRVAIVNVQLSPQGAELSVDGQQVGVAPLESAVYLTPGRHSLRAHLSGHRDLEHTLDARAGESLMLPMALQTASDDGSRPNVAVLIVGSIAGAALVATGIGLLVAASGKASDREELSATLAGTNPCGEGSPYPAECDEVRSLSGTENTFRGLGIAGVAVGGAALVATLLYGVWPREGGDSASIAPFFGPSAAGLVVSGTFSADFVHSF
jgi:hypothetical protein